MTVTCKRHPEVETGLRCSSCEDPICPRCAVASAVGQKCPSCARLPKTARSAGKPRQFVKGLGSGLVVAVAGGIALSLLLLGFGSWIASGFLGYGVSRSVLWGSEGNRLPVFRWGSFAFAVLAVALAWYVRGGVQLMVPPGLGMGTYLAAIYGAYMPYR